MAIRYDMRHPMGEVTISQRHDDKDTILDLARDYILSQDLAEEVVF